jgi:hypothetical protein
MQTDLTSTVAGLGTIYISSPQLVSTVEGLGTTYISSTQLTSTVAGLGSYYASSVTTQGYFSSLGLNTSTPQYTLDVNGPSQSAFYISSVIAGGSMTILPNTFGVFYNIVNVGMYTIELSLTQPASNIGKYNVFRNNTTSTIQFAVTNATGITSPVTCQSLQGVTFAVATTSSYAQF